MKRFTFTKTFTGGLLEGISTACAISFPSEKEAWRWFDAVNEKWAKGETNFYLEDLDWKEDF